MDLQASDLEAPLGDCLSWCERYTERVPRILSEDYVFDLVVGSIDGGWETLLTESGTTVTALRSPELAPTALGFLPEYFRERYVPPYQPSAVVRPESREAFSAFIEARCLGAARRAESTQADADSESEIHRSRALLLTDWASSLSDGASAVASRGFIDQDNLPPWDTWLALLDVRFSADTCRAVIVSWVPRWATELVGEAIEVNPEACLAWAGISRGEIVATDLV